MSYKPPQNILLGVQVNLRRCFHNQQLKNWDGKEQVCSFTEEKLNAAYKLKYRVKMYESNNQTEDKEHIVGIFFFFFFEKQLRACIKQNVLKNGTSTNRPLLVIERVYGFLALMFTLNQASLAK